MASQIYFNGRICTLDPKNPQAEAVLVEEGRVKAVGSTEEILLQSGRAGVTRFDLEGGYVYPGLTDSHLHLMGHGMKLSMLDLSAVRSKEELLYIVRERAVQVPEGSWVLGFNWDENKFSVPVPPMKEELDEVSPNRPVILSRVCYHVHAVNSAALRAAGIFREISDPSDGKYGRDLDGELNGLVYENASQPIFDAIPPWTLTERMNFARIGAQDALSKGLTGVHTEDLRSAKRVKDLIHIFEGLLEEGVRLRTHHLVYYPFLQEFQEIARNLSYKDQWFRFGAVKLFADGSFGGRTALLSQPYADDPSTCGFAVHTEQELEERVRKVRTAGMPIAIHAIGDKAAEMAIQAMENQPFIHGNLRDRLVHGQILREDLLDRMVRMPLAVDIQPRFVASDFPWVMDRLPRPLFHTAYAWKSLLNKGIPIGGGSDAPIEPIDPLLGMHAAITRRSPEGKEVYMPEQKLTPLEALSLFTIGSAQAAGEEKERGTISIGKYADLSVFDRDLLSPEPDSILEATPLLTVVNGEVAYQV
ncbi:amidohydrolase [Melghirimyces algeriensis]|uniref:Amidohydrolase 3 domain-containing protein n=1 Tax=Melghirimyces algeriensis TaxID=910412 RepID=A0A521ERI8_9BACL|nr:amidohydrolase [Melghirimyces algeriensis]SMO86512.1 hypothetical protein SAMN06264849_11075 [Melghirimyces algeriensis]